MQTLSEHTDEDTDLGREVRLRQQLEPAMSIDEDGELSLYGYVDKESGLITYIKEMDEQTGTAIVLKQDGEGGYSTEQVSLDNIGEIQQQKLKDVIKGSIKVFNAFDNANRRDVQGFDLNQALDRAIEEENKRIRRKIQAQEQNGEATQEQTAGQQEQNGEATQEQTTGQQEQNGEATQEQTTGQQEKPTQQTQEEGEKKREEPDTTRETIKNKEKKGEYVKGDKIVLHIKKGNLDTEAEYGDYDGKEFEVLGVNRGYIIVDNEGEQLLINPKMKGVEVEKVKTENSKDNKDSKGNNAPDGEVYETEYSPVASNSYKERYKQGIRIVKTEYGERRETVSISKADGTIEKDEARTLSEVKDIMPKGYELDIEDLEEDGEEFRIRGVQEVRISNNAINGSYGGATVDVEFIDKNTGEKRIIKDYEIRIKKDNKESKGNTTQELQDKLQDWLSDENLEWAEGRVLSEITEKFGNELEPIATIPDGIRNLFSSLDNNYLWSGKGYFIDHAVNHHPELEKEDYNNIQTVLNEFDDIKDLSNSKDGINKIAVVKKLDKGYAVVIELSKENDKIVLHKTFFYKDGKGKRLPFENKRSLLNELSVDGSTTINPTENSSRQTPNISTLGNSQGKGSTNSGTTQAIGGKSLGEKIKDGSVYDNGEEQTYDDLLDELENEEDVETFINNNISNIKTQITKAKKTKTTDIDKIKQEREKIRTLEQQQDYWEKVLDVKAKRKREEQIKEVEEENKRKTEQKKIKEKKEQEKKTAEQERIVSNSGIGGIRQRYEQSKKVEGFKGSKVLPNGEKIKGRYVLVESTGITASHDVNKNFAQSEGFPTREDGTTLNDRDYEKDKQAQGQVRQRATSYDGRAVTDMPIIDNNGIVLSGNDRTMSGQLSAQENMDGAYIESLRENAQMYGFTEEDVESMQHPRLVFVLDENMDYTTENFAKFNQNEKKTQNNIEKAVKIGKTIKAESVKKIAQVIDEYESIAECLSDSKGVKRIIDILDEDGQIQRNDVAQYMNEDVFNEAGKEYIQTVLIGATLSEESVRMINTMPFMKKTVITALNQILQNAKLDSYSLQEEINEAIKVVYEAHKQIGIKQGESLDLYYRQMDLFSGESNIKSRTIEMLADLLNDEKVKELKKILSLYNEEAQLSLSGNIDIFSTTGKVKSKEEILDEIIKNKKDYEQRKRNRQSVAVGSNNTTKSDNGRVDGGKSRDEQRRGERESVGDSETRDKQVEESKKEPTFTYSFEGRQEDDFATVVKEYLQQIDKPLLRSTVERGLKKESKIELNGEKVTVGRYIEHCLKEGIEIEDKQFSPTIMQFYKWAKERYSQKEENKQEKEKTKENKGSGNRLVTDERYEELKKRMQEKLRGQLNMGADPEILTIGIEMAVYHIEKGTRKFVDYAKVMIKDLGDNIRPYLKSFYNGARDLPEMEDLSKDMDSWEEVSKFDVHNFDKEKKADLVEQARQKIADKKAQEEEKQAKEQLSKKEDDTLELFGEKEAEVNSGGIFKEGYSKNKTVIWTVPAVSNSTNTDTIGVNLGTTKGATDTSGNSPQTTVLDDKNTTKTENTEKNRKNYHKGAGKVQRLSTPIVRYSANINAVKLLRKIEAEGRQATKEEQEILAKYTGWGGLGMYFKEGTKEYEQLRELLSAEEFENATASLSSAFYTPEEVIESMWQIVEQLGFDGGKILEGSAGIGNILSQIPEKISDRSDIRAVEIDSISGGILRLLYPEAEVEVKGFEESRVKPASVDLAITNVPFVTGLKVFDESNKDLSKKFSNIHDFCIAKNIRALKEGGIGIFITSKGTLDSSKKLTEWITNDKGGRADVVGAFRLNNSTFAGTSVTSDIIVVRKRVKGRVSKDAIDVSSIVTDRRVKLQTNEYDYKKGEYVEKEVPLMYNGYFKEHPECMGGEMYLNGEKGDTYRPMSSGLFGTEKEQRERLKVWVENFGKQEKVSPVEEEEMELYEDTEVKDGGLLVNSDDRLCMSYEGKAVPLGLKSDKNKINGKYSWKECLEDYNDVKTCMQNVLDAQDGNANETAIKQTINELNEAYDKFVSKYGYFSHNNKITALRRDVDYPVMMALEDDSESVVTIDEKTGKKKEEYKIKKTKIFRERVINPKTEQKPKSVKDGVILSQQNNGNIDVEWIAEELGKSVDDVTIEIVKKKLGFVDPLSGEVVISYDYLSGNVREKLQIARENNVGGIYDPNIFALEEVLPPTIPAHLINVQIGNSWVNSEVFKKFLTDKYEISPNGYTMQYIGGSWSVSKSSNYAFGKNREQGVYSSMCDKTISVLDMFLALMNNRSITVQKTEKEYDYEQGKNVTRTKTDEEATQRVNARMEELKQEFREWMSAEIQDNEELAREIERSYNEKCNNYVPMNIGDEFLPERFVGASESIMLHPHQKRAVMRSLTSPTLLAHEVGTGKTFTMITTAMEMRRLGLSEKPMIVVQNATLNQFAGQVKTLYPNAKVLVATESDKDKDGRKYFASKVRNNDWDIVVIPQSMFNALPDNEKQREDYVNAKLIEKEKVVEALKEQQELIKESGDVSDMGLQVAIRTLEKEIEGIKERKKGAEDLKKEQEQKQKTKAKAQEQMSRKTDEDNLTLSGMGVDALFVDEAHEYKKLGFETSMGRGIKGVDTKSSKRAVALYLKTREIFAKRGNKNVVFATGTPISNTAAEIWTFMKYLMPSEALKEAEVYYFDDFARNFGKISTILAFGTNGKFREQTRFAGYNGITELVRLWSSFADTVLKKEEKSVNEREPEIEGGKEKDIFLEQTPSFAVVMSYIKDKLREYERMSGKQKKENSHIPLTMFTLAKQSAIDARLVTEQAVDEENSKPNNAVRLIKETLEETKSYRGTIAVFSDNYQNKNSGFNLFEDMKQKLIEQGVKEEEIFVMKSGMTDKKKAEVFARVNSGEIRVIMGTTQMLGVGVNIQERLHTEIHLDAPLRPMDYQQRVGRIIRQGNLHRSMNVPVRIVRFGVKNSLDVSVYQLLSIKEKMITSIMDSKQRLKDPLSDREYEEESVETNYDNPVAQLSGSQYAMLHNQAKREYNKWKNKEREYEQNQVYAKKTIPQNEDKIRRRTEILEKYQTRLAGIEKNFAEGVKSITIGSNVFKNKEQAEKIIKEKITKKITEQENKLREDFTAQGTKISFDIKINKVPIKIEVELTKKVDLASGKGKSVVSSTYSVSCEELSVEKLDTKKHSFKTALEYVTDVLINREEQERGKNVVEQELATLEKENSRLKELQDKKFEYSKELSEAKEKMQDYEKRMQEELKAIEEEERKMLQQRPEEIMEDVNWDELVENAMENAEAQEKESEKDNEIKEERVEEEEEELSVNEQFNKDLELLEKGLLPDSYIFNLGMPNEILRASGVKNLPIELKAKKLKEKSEQDNHRFDLQDVKGLVKAIENPIMVFDSKTQAGRKVILTELTDKNGVNYVVALGTTIKGNSIEVNDIKSIYPKDATNGVIGWINSGLLRYANKNKAIEWVSRQRSDSAEATNQNNNLDSVAKVLQNFENPKIEERKKAESGLKKDEQQALTEGITEVLGNAIGKENVVTDNEEAQKVIEEHNKRIKREHRVYHGSPYEFTEFDHSKMGTGEGAQAFGWGSYVTEVEGIGKAYAEKGKTTDRNLYTVEIPEDNGNNYLYWDKPVNDNIISKIQEYLKENYRKRKLEEFNAGILAKSSASNREEVEAWQRRGENVYKMLTYLLGEPKEVSKALSNMGLTGISYPANAMRGGREDGARNFVIFNEKDLKITDHIKFFKTKNGQAYGFTVNGKVYIDTKIAKASTPIHEYTHLWAEALRQSNPKEWKNIVELMKKEKYLWDKVRRMYPELKTEEEIADEVLAHYSGKRGAELLEEEAKKIKADNKRSVFDKARALQTIENVKKALERFWKGVADFFNIHFTTAEEVADKVLSDMLNGVNPNEYIARKGNNANTLQDNREYTSEEQAIIEKAKKDGTYMKAPNGKKTNLTERQWVQVRTKAFKNWFGDWEKKTRIDKLRKSKSIEATGEEYKGKYELNNKSAEKYIKDELRGEYTNKDTKETIKITKVGAEKVTHHDVESEIHLKSVALIPEMLENAIFITEETNEKAKRGFDSYKYYVVGLKINGVDYTAKLVVGVKNGQTYYDHALTEISKEKLLNERDGVKRPVYQKESSFDINNVKDKRLLSILEDNSSKVVDENGEPLVVYHGTDVQFTSFDPKEMRDSEGSFFFAENKEDAESYAYEIPTMEVFINIKKPFDYENDTVPEDYQGRWENAENKREQVEILKELGYDGWIGDFENGKGWGEISAFNPNQIKSATDNIGTFDKGNNDIRYQFIGEQGAERIDAYRKSTQMLDNLQVARDMAKAGKDTKSIKLATGWEKGKDGKWRYEIEDVKIKDINNLRSIKYREKEKLRKEIEQLQADEFELFEDMMELDDDKDSEKIEKIEQERAYLRRTISQKEYERENIDLDTFKLTDILSEDNGLFEMYPYLKRTRVRFYRKNNTTKRGSYEENVFNGDLIEINELRQKGAKSELATEEEIRETLLHEIQHSIQREEGFANGSNVEHQIKQAGITVNGGTMTVNTEDELYKLNKENEQYENRIKWVTDTLGKSGDATNLLNSLRKKQEEVKNKIRQLAYERYKKTAGEVEARNVSRRMQMSAEERLNSLAEETEDVAREEQTIIRQGLVSASMQSVEDNREVKIVKAEKEHGFKNIAEAREWAKENITGVYNNAEIGEVRVSNKAIEKYLSQKAVEQSSNKDLHLSVLKVLPQLIEESIVGEIHGDRNGNENIKDIVRLYGAMSVDGKMQRVKITVKRYNSENEKSKAYSYEVTEIESLDGRLTPQTQRNDNVTTSNNSISATKLLQNFENPQEEEEFFENNIKFDKVEDEDLEDNEQENVEKSEETEAERREREIDEALEDLDVEERKVKKGILKWLNDSAVTTFADDYHSLRKMEDEVVRQMRKKIPGFRLPHSVYEQQIASKSATEGQIFLFTEQVFKPLLNKVREIAKKNKLSEKEVEQYLLFKFYREDLDKEFEKYGKVS